MSGNPVTRLVDRLIRALDAAWGRVDTRYANALNTAEDEL